MFIVFIHFVSQHRYTTIKSAHDDKAAKLDELNDDRNDNPDGRPIPHGDAIPDCLCNALLEWHAVEQPDSNALLK